jgi:hypothetical protein
LSRSLFRRLVHADWSIGSSKRWIVEAPRPVAELAVFVDSLLQPPHPTLAGFDFPIGLPANFGHDTALAGFTDALEQFGVGAWSHFYDVAEDPGEISIHRPFYPRRTTGSPRRADLVEALNARDFDALRRKAERATPGRRAACPLFWTLGSNQVGRAAISGWRDILQPARQRGALLWPFDGPLSELAAQRRLAICETYPAEAYGHIGIRFPPGASKRRRADRAAVAAALPSRCGAHDIHLTGTMSNAISDGFGPRPEGEDAFDAAMGLLAMIEVVEGRRVEGPTAAEVCQ